MDEKLEQELVKRYPKLYKDHGGDPRQTCMAWGLAVGDGWYHILDNLSAGLMLLSGKYGIDIIADQVKEKFGGLRFYYHTEGKVKWYHKRFHWFQSFIFKFFSPKTYWKIIDFRKKLWRTPYEKISDLVAYAEQMSYETCERCSQPGKRVGGGWVQTLCKDCESDNEE